MRTARAKIIKGKVVTKAKFPDPTRWDLERLRATAKDDHDLAEAGIESWADELDALDRR